MINNPLFARADQSLAIEHNGVVREILNSACDKVASQGELDLVSDNSQQSAVEKYCGGRQSSAAFSSWVAEVSSPSQDGGRF